MTDIVERLRNTTFLQVSHPHFAPIAEAAHEAADEIESLRSRLAEAEREARVLVVAMADQCGAPDNWKPLPDAAGMITQISNMVAGLRDERALLVARAENAEAALVEADRNEETLLGMIRHQRDVLRECLPYINESMAGRRPGRCADDIRAAVKALTADSGDERNG